MKLIVNFIYFKVKKLLLILFILKLKNSYETHEKMDYSVFRYAKLEPKTSFYYSNGKGRLFLFK